MNVVLVSVQVDVCVYVLCVTLLSSELSHKHFLNIFLKLLGVFIKIKPCKYDDVSQFYCRPFRSTFSAFL